MPIMNTNNRFLVYCFKHVKNAQKVFQDIFYTSSKVFGKLVFPLNRSLKFHLFDIVTNIPLRGIYHKSFSLDKYEQTRDDVVKYTVGMYIENKNCIVTES